MELPMTFADFAITEVRFRKHFRMAPPDTWNENMVPLAEFLELATDEREGTFPYVWTRRPQAAADAGCWWPSRWSSRARTGATSGRCCARSPACGEAETPREEIEEQVRREVVGRIASGLMQPGRRDRATRWRPWPESRLAQPPRRRRPRHAAAAADVHGAVDRHREVHRPATSASSSTRRSSPTTTDKKAVIKDPNGGPYKDLVKAAERCTAQVIHPGLPRDRSAKDIEKWIKRGEKFN